MTTIHEATLADAIDQQDAADLAGLSVGQLTHRRNIGEAPAHVQLRSGVVVYSRTAVLEWVAAGWAPGGDLRPRVPRGRQVDALLRGRAFNEARAEARAAAQGGDDDGGDDDDGAPGMAMRRATRRQHAGDDDDGVRAAA